MPSVPVGTYFTADEGLNLARAIVNDMLRSSAGQTLSNTKPYTIEYLNAAVEDCQEYLANNGVTSNIKDDVILSPLTPVQNVNPGVQVYVSVEGYFDGSVMHSTPALPPDMILPLRLWERQTGSGQTFQPMNQPEDGLPSVQQGTFFSMWEWREDKIALFGATQSRDLRVRYEAALLPIKNDADLTKAIIKIRGGKRAVAFAVAEYFAAARGAPQQTWANQQKTARLDELVNRQVRKDQRIAFRPKAYNADRGSIDGSLSGSFK